MPKKRRGYDQFGGPEPLDEAATPALDYTNPKALHYTPDQLEDMGQGTRLPATPQTSYVGCVVEVEWEDAHGDSNQSSEEEVVAMHMPIVRTIGLCLADEAERIVLSGEIITLNKGTYTETTYRANSIVPRGMVRGVRVL